MTRFTESTTLDGLDIRHMPGIDPQEMATQLNKAITHSGNALTLARAHLDKNTPVAAHFAAKYFLIDLKGSEGSEHRDKIKAVLGKILVGIGQNKTFKIGKNVNKSGDEVIGEVKATYPPDMDKVHGGHTHNKMKDMETGKHASWGIIKLEAKQLLAATQWNKLRILIHEHSHKYAGTTDYMYFDNIGEFPRGTFDDPKKALTNADSFAWFATAIYKKAIEDHLAKKTTS